MKSINLCLPFCFGIYLQLLTSQYSVPFVAFFMTRMAVHIYILFYWGHDDVKPLMNISWQKQLFSFTNFMECNGKGRLYTAVRGPGIGGRGKTKRSLDFKFLGAQMVAECLCLFTNYF